MLCLWVSTIFLISCSICAADRGSGVQLGVFRHKPYGPFYCRSRCVATCIETGMAPNISSCLENFCWNFDENTPCDHYDATCWQNCGHQEPETGHDVPKPVDDIKTIFTDRDGVADPYTMHIIWEPQKDVHLYIIEIFPIRTAFGRNEDKVVQTVTTASSYVFQRPDLCGTFMARIMAVNRFGLSISRYKRLNEWNLPTSDIDLQIQFRSFERSSEYPFAVKVLLDYKKPRTWKDGDVVITNSNLRAFDCNYPIEPNSGFGDTTTDTDGFYWPIAFINESSLGIEISLPVDVLYPQCKFLYKILEMKTRCGVTTTFDSDDKKNEVAFALNCYSVPKANCLSQRLSQTSNPLKLVVDSEPVLNDNTGDVPRRPFAAEKPALDSDHDMTSDPPPEPWSVQVLNNDTLWSLFLSFLRGAGEQGGATRKSELTLPEEKTEVAEEPNGPVLPKSQEQTSTPVDTDLLQATSVPSLVPLPDAAPDSSDSRESDSDSQTLAPLESSETTTDSLSREFQKAFEESIANPSTDESLPANSKMEAFAIRPAGGDSDPDKTLIKHDSASISTKPVLQVTVPQLATFIAFITVMLVVLAILTLTCIGNRRSTRKEHIVI